MRLVVIDNYDSFTYNLVHLLAEICHEPPLVVKNDEISWNELKQKQFDGIVISPGPGHPEQPGDFGLCTSVIEEAEVPLLGVCLGHQGIAALSGGRVVRAPAPMHGRTSLIHHNDTGLFSGIPSPFRGARYHSLVAQQPVPSCLEVTAWTEDGLIMGLAHRDRPQWGVQFHPESIITEHGRKLLENFCRMIDASGSHSNGQSLNGKSLNGKSLNGASPNGKSLNGSAHRKELAAARKRTFWKEIPREIDMEDVFTSLFSESPHAYWLDSSLVEQGRARWSYAGDASGPNAACIQYRCSDKRIEISDRTGNHIKHTGIFEYLERIEPSRPEPAPPCPFVGGYVGWFGYELRNDSGSPTDRSAATPDAMFIYSDRFIAVDHVEKKTYVLAIDEPSNADRAKKWIDHTIATIERAAPPAMPEVRNIPNEPIKFYLDRDRETYLSDIRRCLDLIGQGETYQVCLTNELHCNSDVDPLTLYRTMRKVNPAPHAAFIRWPEGAVLSASPERFLAIDTNGRVETKPIKGTIKRDQDPLKDDQLAEQLRTSEKDRAENVMIVDLLRNDLSRSCTPGSVRVPKLFDVESYRTVHQLVSTVTGTLELSASPVQLIRNAFPGGSMTGAPKTRTLRFIDELEGRARGVYSGSLGWLGTDGAVDLSIVIRTIVASGGRLSMGVGGGVVAASTAEGEFDEMLLKAAASIKSVVVALTGGFSPDRYELVGADEAGGSPTNPN
ncbi:aminodeoxychorismate synthase component I [Bradyrhizobium sp. LTSP857]|uniref:aminodeoxychorismate synthase component I n=1 Tax=Bradyrhizobium sp. LTSP857 TaxID=1619231 RepID=UPI0005D2BFAE|nr:aminodeoxychorismate synthase component I [Bradyrhizobium sp. LTSP857]KJC38700.1 aminobenzoate synthetase [Bradyrhizobium sp. LTSP857]